MSDEEYFQSVDKFNALEIVNSSTYTTSKIPSRKTVKQNNHQWKFQKIKRVNPHSLSPRKLQTKNISFQTEQLIEISQSGQSSNEQDKYSVFTKKYANCEQTYHKKPNIGNKWLGRKQYFASIFVNPSKLQDIDILSLFKDVQSKKYDNKLYFQSNFQSGNLHSAYQIRKNQYDLILQNDINTKGNTQWFYFQMKNVPAKTKIKMNIVNMLKSDSLFNYGMQPCILSERANINSNQGWIRSGSHIKYFRNQNRIDGGNRFYYTLTFTISTLYDGDNIKVAQSYPYTVTDLKNYLDKIEKKPGIKNILKRQQAGITLGKNVLQVIRIYQQNPRKKDNRSLIFISARQHPGQTPGSYVCQGFINYLISQQKQAVYLRKNYEIVIMPMLNPDGVMVGNYRTNLNGLDLNRRWDGSKINKVKQVVMIKKYMTQIARGKDICFFIDLHGHSRKLFSFFYGNTGVPDPLSVRIFPYICAKNSEGRIRFQDSTFVCEQQKRRTARIQLGQKFKIPNIFTFETSFFGYMNKKRQKIHFTREHYRNIGQVLGFSLYMHQRSKSNPESVEASIVSKYYNQLKNKPQLIQRGNRPCSGSQSEPEKGQIRQKQYQMLTSKDNKQGIQKQKKNNKKSLKKDIIVKQISKASRQLHVMDIARVNSIFPNDILALMPSSYAAKNKKSVQSQKKISYSIGIQTDQVPLIKIYDMCKIQQAHEETIMVRSTNSKFGQSYSSPPKSNLFRTVIRPKSSSSNYLQQINTSSGKRQIKKRHDTGHIQNKNPLNKCHSLSQTLITFPPKADLVGKNMEPISVSINSVPKSDPIKKKNNYSTLNSICSSEIQTINNNKRSMQSFKIGLRALNVETWRIKKKNIQ